MNGTVADGMSEVGRGVGRIVLSEAKAPGFGMIKIDSRRRWRIGSLGDGFGLQRRLIKSVININGNCKGDGKGNWSDGKGSCNGNSKCDSKSNGEV